MNCKGKCPYPAQCEYENNGQCYNPSVTGFCPPETKPIIHLCNRHYAASDWNDKYVVLTERQSCDICKEK